VFSVASTIFAQK